MVVLTSFECLKNKHKLSLQIKVITSKLDFPVYNIEDCPRNESEWTKRAAAINCTKANGYLCVPNNKLTNMVELCSNYDAIGIKKGKIFCPAI